MDLVRERLANQFLTTRGPARASEVVRALGAVQAQDYAGAKWALSQRAGDASESEIERELIEGAILRTHVLRPTWHFVAPEDIRWMLALTGPRIAASMASYNRRLELTPAIFRKTHAVITKALAGGKQLTRTALKELLARARVGEVSGQRLAHMMMQAELDAVVCSGAMQGKQFTYGLLDERVPAAAARERDDALGELARRYFSTRGPATTRDFSWWSGLTIADCKRAVEIAGGALEQARIAAQTYWFVPRSATPPAGPSAHLLPNYDEYFIGFRDRSAIARRVRDLNLVSGGDALIANIVFVDGMIVGGWKRTFARKRAIVTLKLLSRLTRTERQRVAAALDRFSAFLGQEVELNES